MLHAENVKPDRTITVTYEVPVKPGLVTAKFVNDVTSTKTFGGETKPGGNDSVQGYINNTLDVEKRSATPVFNPDTHKTIVYTVTVKAPSSNTTTIPNAYIEDTFTLGGDLVKSVKKTSGNVTFEPLTTINDVPGFKVQLGDMAPGSTVMYTYEADLDSDKCYFDNTPSTKWLDNWAAVKSGGTEFDKSKANASFQKQFTQKSGVFDITTNKFKFTATYDGRIPGTSDRYYDGALKSFEDIILTDGFTFAGTPAPVLEAFQGDNVVKTKTLDGSLIDGKNKFTMLIPSDMVGPYSYRLIYYVNLPAGAVPDQNETVGNKFTAHMEGVGDGGSNMDFESQSTASSQGSVQNAVSKRVLFTSHVADDKFAPLEYTIQITSPVAQGAVLHDKVEQNEESDFDVKLPISYLKEDMTITYNGNKLKLGEDYTLESEDDDNNTFKITFLKTFPDASTDKPMVISYHGQLVASAKGKTDAANPTGGNKVGTGGTTFNYVKLDQNETVTTGWKKDNGASINSYIEKTLVDTSANPDVPKNMLCWKVKLDSARYPVHAFAGWHDLVDEVPAGQKIVKVERYTDEHTPVACVRNDSGTLGEYEYTVSENGRKVTINAYGGHQNHYENYLIWTQIDDQALMDQGIDPDNFGDVTFSNKASYKCLGTTWNVENSTQYSLHRNSKTFEYTGGTQQNGGVKFTLTINEDGSDMDPNSNTLTIHDTMNRELTLMKDTLRINGKTIDQIPEASLSYDEGSNKFDLVIPDGQKCVITYMAAIDAEVGETGWLENKAEIDGRIGVVTSEDKLQEKLDVSAGSTSMYSFYIRKNDANGKMLLGAKFLLNQVKLQDGELVEEALDTAANPNGESLDMKDGTYKYRGVKKTANGYDCVYALMETTAPDGCEKDPEVHYLAFGTNIDPALKAKLTAEGKTIETAHTGQGANLENMFTIKNDDEKINIPVKKVWDDASDLDGLRPQSITLKLKADGQVIKTETVTGTGDTWNYTFQNLPTYKTNDDGTRSKITYAVEEDRVTGYDVPDVSGSVKDGYTVTNTHEVPKETTKDFTGKKTLKENGTDKAMTAGQFKFTVAADPSNPAAIGNLPTGEIEVAANGSFDLGTLTFKKAGTYKFTVSEVQGNAVGYTYDDKPVTVTVPVTLDTVENELKIGTVTYQKNGQPVNGIVFENTYTTPGAASKDFTGKKTLKENGNDKTMTAGQFEFTVTAGQDNPGTIGGLPTANVKVAADGTFDLGTLTFPKAGNYTFTVAEVDGNRAGYTYDNKPVKVTVPVTFDEATNTLSVGTATYTKDGQPATGIVFENTYTTPDSATQNFTGTKTLKENGNDKTMKAGQFTFTATADENNPAEIGGFPEGPMSVTANGGFSLGALTFPTAGTYKITVAEVNGGAAGYSYDAKPVTATIVVKLDTTTNKLVVDSVAYHKDGNEVNGFVFENTYTTPGSGSMEFSGTKKLTENGEPKAMTAGQFEFKVTADGSNPAAITGLPTENVKVTDAGTFNLGALSFPKVGTYKFTVAEVNGGAAGYTYDAKPVTVTVNVTLDEATNKLVIGTPTYEKNGNPVDGIEFKNEYTTPDSATQNFTGKKTLKENGTDKAMTAGQFKFTVAAGENNPADITGLPEGELSVNADGTFALGELTFEKAGTYTFTVSEVNENKAGYTYDADPVTATVKVKLDTDTNKLVIDSVKYEKADDEVNGFVFDNTYTTPDPIEKEFTGSKTLTENDEAKAIKDGQFEFKVTADEDNPAEVEGLPTENLAVTETGTFDLGTWTFTKVGTYKFTVEEIDGGAAGYTYDANPVTITVVVTLNEETNEFEFDSVTYEKAQDEVDGIVFENTYTTPDPAEETITGTKNLTENGKPKAIKDGQFKFTVTEDENNPAKIDGLHTELSVKADGTFDLGKLSFSKAGIYVFTVAEINGGEKGYTYDDAAVKVTVEVVLNEETNKLEVKTVQYEKGGETADGIVFNNTYKPDPKPTTVTGHHPNTGDNSNMGMWITLLVLAGALVIVLLVMSRKRSDEK